MSSCQKEKDTEDPVIIITDPSENQIFQLPDNMQVTASVTDEIPLEWVKVVVVDENQTPFFPSINYYPVSPVLNINETYLLENLLLESGKYFLKISASDGTNTKNAFVSIFLNEVPRNLENILVLTSSGDYLDLYACSDYDNAEKWLEIDGDFSDSEVNSRHQQFYLSGFNKINFQTFDLTDRLPEWKIDPVPYLPFHEPDNLFFDGELIFISFKEGFIRAYDRSGINKFATPFNLDTEPTVVFRQGNYVVAALIDQSGYDRYLAAYYFVSGIEKSLLQIDFSIIGFFALDTKRIFVLGNKDGIGKIYLFNLENDQISLLHEITQGTIITSTALDNSNLLISCDEDIFWYRYDINSLVPFIQGKSVNRILYEDLEKLVLLVTSNTIEVVRFPFAGPVGMIHMQDSVLNAHLLYNK